MYKLTDLIAKRVISISQGTQLGTVENAVFDRKLSKITHLCVFSEEYEDKLYIPASYIINAFNEAVMVKSMPADEPPKTVRPMCPLKAKVYLEDGREYGYIEDALIDEKLALSEFVLGDGSRLKSENIISFSGSAAIACFDTARLEELKKIKPKKSPAAKTVKPPAVEIDVNEKGENAQPVPAIEEIKPQEEETVQSVPSAEGELSAYQMPAAPQQAETAIAEQSVIKEPVLTPKAEEAPIKSAQADAPTEEDLLRAIGDKELVPRSIVPPFNYLIGRRTTEDIFNQLKEIIVPKNTVINMKHINICRLYGKLIMLAKNSKVKK